MGDEGAGGSHSRDWIHEPLSKMSISDPGAVMDLLNCQSCSEPMYPPIYQVYSCSDQHFCFHFEAMKMPKDIVYIAFMTFLGDDSDGKDFRYRLEVNNGSRKMAWVGVPRSIRDGQKKVWESGHGLIIHSSVAKIFCATTGDTDNQEIFRKRRTLIICGSSGS